MATLQQGRIVWVRVVDPAGRNPKLRPAVIVTRTSEITATEPMVGVAVSSTFKQPLSASQNELPWQQGGHPVTGLNRRCVAVCEWVIRFTTAEVESVGGTVPHSILLRIVRFVGEALK